MPTLKKKRRSTHISDAAREVTEFAIDKARDPTEFMVIFTVALASGIATLCRDKADAEFEHTLMMALRVVDDAARERRQWFKDMLEGTRH